VELAAWIGLGTDFRHPFAPSGRDGLICARQRGFDQVPDEAGFAAD
jgi:hypothetical protein